MGRTCASASETVRDGRIKSVPNGTCRLLTVAQLLNLERERDQDKRCEGSVNTSHMSRSRSKGKVHASQKWDDNRSLQQEIDDLKKKLRRAQRRHPSPSSDTSDEEDNEYRQRSRTSPSETFSYEEE